MILLPVFGIGLFLFIITFLQTLFTNFTITNQRIIEKTGVFSRLSDETELYRIKDITLNQPFFLRIFGLSTIILITSDKTSPIIKLPGIKNGIVLSNELRKAVDIRRDEKGVKERDFE